jgi:predicted MFS family arabinose efflux permease
MGMLQFTTVIAQLTSMMISGYMVDHWGWNTPFILGGIVAAAALLLALRLPEQNQEKRKAIQIKDLAEAVKEPLLVKVSLLSVLAHCVLFITMFGYTPNQALDIGASKESLGWLTLAFMLPHAVATLYGSRLFGRWLGDRGTLMLVLPEVRCSRCSSLRCRLLRLYVRHRLGTALCRVLFSRCCLVNRSRE